MTHTLELFTLLLPMFRPLRALRAEVARLRPGSVEEAAEAGETSAGGASIARREPSA